MQSFGKDQRMNDANSIKCKKKDCPICKGTGTEIKIIGVCQVCQGEGGLYFQELRCLCTQCFGVGHFFRKLVCSLCEGTGVVYVEI